MTNKKIINKIESHTSEIIFGILAGSGLIFIINTLLVSLILIIPTLQLYTTILYVALYLIILLPTSTYYAKGWFKAVYLTAALILLLVYIYAKVFGGTV